MCFVEQNYYLNYWILIWISMPGTTPFLIMMSPAHKTSFPLQNDECFIILITLQRITTHSNLGIYREPIKRRGLMNKNYKCRPLFLYFHKRMIDIWND